MHRWSKLLGAALATVVAGCNGCGASGNGCEDGRAGCPCVDGFACLTGLSCVAGRCVAGGADAGRDGGSDGGSGGRRDGGSDAGPLDATGGLRDAAPNPDAFFADDPPPMECREDGTRGEPAMPPGGTPECPDDKNREGCRCNTVGERAPCWPGLRVNRGRGICRDGTTECLPFDEFSGAWGPCEGYVLPTEGATLGPEACRCFSRGRWEIDNLSPCFITYGSGEVYAVSTTVVGGTAMCPTVPSMPPPPAPPGTWSTDRLTVDCEGRFELCYTIRAGNFEAPSPTDCVLAETCVETWYAERDVTQELPPLPSWTSSDTACARRFRDSGGYGEMSVRGLSVECDAIDDGSGGRYVFNRVNYCPLSCNTMPDAPGCERCMMGGSGTF